MLTPVLLAIGLAFALPPVPAAEPARATSIRIGDSALQYVADHIAPVLAANERGFRGRTGPVEGFGAGAAYPQLWLRDSATLLPVARFLYPRSRLTSWVEEHLAHQQADGALFDWIAVGGTRPDFTWAPHGRVLAHEDDRWVTADKNTVEADQESSAVIAAAQVFAAIGDREWLRKDVAGRGLLARADAALSFLLAQRRDPETGLVVSGFAADWGDVSPSHDDQQAIYLDDQTPRVVGLYTNAMAYAALRALAALQAADGNEARAAYWRAEAAKIQAGVERVLGPGPAGFYRMHRVVSGRSPMDDADLFAMGGHAVGILSGLIPPARAPRVLDAAERRRRALGLSTVSFALMPPYPEGVFRHPLMAKPYRYQNGGQWDWFGARLVRAEFENGRAARARDHLQALARETERSQGLFEWRDRDGGGQGSAQYAGTAAALGAALLQGLLGIDLGSDRLSLCPRLGTLAAQAHLQEPATGSTIDYAYTFDAPDLAFDAEVRPARPTRIAVLLPAGWALGTATLDGARLAARVFVRGADRYAAVETDGHAHRLRLRLRPRNPPAARPLRAS